MEDWNNGIWVKIKKKNFSLTHYSTVPSFIVPIGLVHRLSFKVHRFLRASFLIAKLGRISHIKTRFLEICDNWIGRVRL